MSYTFYPGLSLLCNKVQAKEVLASVTCAEVDQ